MDKFKALKSLCPTANFQLDEDDYDKLIWHSPEIGVPPLEEVTQEVSRLQAEYDAKEYQRQRAPEYPPITDQLDALFHAGVFPPEMAAQIQAVKDKYPKTP
jgi:hypothetical protein